MEARPTLFDDKLLEKVVEDVLNRLVSHGYVKEDRETAKEEILDISPYQLDPYKIVRDLETSAWEGDYFLVTVFDNAVYKLHRIKALEELEWAKNNKPEQRYKIGDSVMYKGHKQIISSIVQNRHNYCIEEGLHIIIVPFESTDLKQVE